MAGVRVRHTGGLANVCHVVPVIAKPYANGPLDCPTCHTLHPVKSVHLWLEPDGSVIVSEGVLADLRLAGMPSLEVVNEVAAPPPLRFGRTGPKVTGGDNARQVMDNQNRSIIVSRG